jgi:hypothetical protein
VCALACEWGSGGEGRVYNKLLKCPICEIRSVTNSCRKQMVPACVLH